jgi:hypothetical protein
MKNRFLHANPVGVAAMVVIAFANVEIEPEYPPIANDASSAPSLRVEAECCFERATGSLSPPAHPGDSFPSPNARISAFNSVSRTSSAASV